MTMLSPSRHGESVCAHSYIKRFAGAGDDVAMRVACGPEEHARASAPPIRHTFLRGCRRSHDYSPCLIRITLTRFLSPSLV
ncbi:hypothetical protein IF1G_04460 [Cordyceps javanica]|uniref:Uncharacterized protein n=1 Tax=Cordyceps javanica TaxID=43265 RepID=A0A545V670_9HYPO|nr:hypothetical protein IF1G_04460 [Cordyceps javanica]